MLVPLPPSLALSYACALTVVGPQPPFRLAAWPTVSGRSLSWQRRASCSPLHALRSRMLVSPRRALQRQLVGIDHGAPPCPRRRHAARSTVKRWTWSIGPVHSWSTVPANRRPSCGSQPSHRRSALVIFQEDPCVF